MGLHYRTASVVGKANRMGPPTRTTYVRTLSKTEINLLVTPTPTIGYLITET